jgi:hypothetical protein
MDQPPDLFSDEKLTSAVEVGWQILNEHSFILNDSPQDGKGQGSRRRIACCRIGSVRPQGAFELRFWDRLIGDFRAAPRLPPCGISVMCATVRAWARGHFPQQWWSRH